MTAASMVGHSVAHLVDDWVARTVASMADLMVWRSVVWSVVRMVAWTAVLTVVQKAVHLVERSADC